MQFNSLLKINSLSARSYVIKFFIVLFSVSLGLQSCSDPKILQPRTAMNEIRHYLENTPVYEMTEMAYGEVRLRSAQDQKQIDAYKKLEQYGYIKMELMKESKRFLSKDSTFTYLISLTDKTIPFVLEKTDKKVKVKTFYYELDDTEEAHLEQTGKNRMKATVTLHRKETDFADLVDKTNRSHATFIKKSYTFRFNDQFGWEIAP
jgi:hypothetical protein